MDIELSYILLWTSSAAVIIGIVLEELGRVIDVENSSIRRIWEVKLSTIFERSGFVLLIAGLASELLIQVHIESLNSIARKQSEDTIAVLQYDGEKLRLEAKVVEERIATAQSEVAKARVETAKINERAENLRLDLAKIGAWRELSPEQSDDMVKRLKEFAGTRFDVAVTLGYAEPLNFVPVVIGILKQSGWVQVAWDKPGEGYKAPSELLIGIIPASAITFFIEENNAFPEKRQADVKAVAAAINAFRHNHVGAIFLPTRMLPLDATHEREGTGTGTGIHVVVGDRPTIAP